MTYVARCLRCGVEVGEFTEQAPLEFAIGIVFSAHEANRPACKSPLDGSPILFTMDVRDGEPKRVPVGEEFACL